MKCHRNGKKQLLGCSLSFLSFYIYALVFTFYCNIVIIFRSIVAPFTVANNMLTPKLSIRRHKVIGFYNDIINRMYNDDGISSDADCETNHRDVV